MKATGIVRRIDDLGHVVIPKEIRRTMRIREGDPLHTTLTGKDQFCFAMLELSKRLGLEFNDTDRSVFARDSERPEQPAPLRERG